MRRRIPQSQDIWSFSAEPSHYPQTSSQHWLYQFENTDWKCLCYHEARIGYKCAMNQKERKIPDNLCCLKQPNNISLQWGKILYIHVNNCTLRLGVMDMTFVISLTKSIKKNYLLQFYWFVFNLNCFIEILMNYTWIWIRQCSFIHHSYQI